MYDRSDINPIVPIHTDDDDIKSAIRNCNNMQWLTLAWIQILDIASNNNNIANDGLTNDVHVDCGDDRNCAWEIMVESCEIIMK